MTAVAVLGTGIMGAPMARHLAQAGHRVRVWNRTRAKAEPLGEHGVEVADTPAEAVSGVDAVVTMLSDGPAVEDSIRRAQDALAGGTLWIQMSTVGVEATERLAALAQERELVFVDAPVRGSRSQAEDGQLFVLASGPDSERERCAPIFEAIAQGAVWLGEAGQGSRLKLVLNHWVLCSVEAIAETFALAEALGVDPRRFPEIIEGGAMDMGYVHLKGDMIMRREFPPAFPLALADKDLRLILEAADGRMDAPLARAVRAQFERAIELGHGGEDMAATYYASRPRSKLEA